MTDMTAGAMALRLWFRGVGLGLAIAAPVGPIGILCIRRTLAQGWRLGLLSGLGAATADGLYGCVAALGLGALSGLLVAQRSLLQGAGGLFLLYLGVQSWRQAEAMPGEAIAPASSSALEAAMDAAIAPPSSQSPTQPSLPQPGNSSWPHAQLKADLGAYLRAYSSTLALTLANPATILAFGAIFAGAGLGNLTSPTGTTAGAFLGESASPELGAALSLIFGIVCGSASWWLLLCGLTQHLGRSLTPRQLRWIGRGSGVALGGFGLAVLLHLGLGAER